MVMRMLVVDEMVNGDTLSGNLLDLFQ